MLSINKSKEHTLGIETGDTCLLHIRYNDVPLSIIFLNLNKIIIRQNVLRPVAKPVDNVEDEEEERHRNQEESVSVDVIRAAAIFLRLLQILFNIWLDIKILSDNECPT